jgi:hypothetical protein
LEERIESGNGNFPDNSLTLLELRTSNLSSLLTEAAADKDWMMQFVMPNSFMITGQA